MPRSTSRYVAGPRWCWRLGDLAAIKLEFDAVRKVEAGAVPGSAVRYSCDEGGRFTIAAWGIWIGGDVRRWRRVAR